jgi:formylglycine-generating enzyme required for sulfatase activity/tRNA A-37 threonylcarbamoyl transferase component Bud32
MGFGLRQVVGEPADAIVQVAEVVEKGLPTAAKIIKVAERHFRDHSRTLPNALGRAHKRAWQSLGVALAGDGFLDRVKVFFASGDNKGIREQVQLFLRENAFSFDGTPDGFRQACLDDLRRLHESGLLSVQGVSSAEVARQATTFRRHADPQGLVAEAHRAVAGIADTIAEHYPDLSRLIRRPMPAGPPLLAAAFCYFFRREVETSGELARGLLFDGQQQLFANQKDMLAGLERLTAAQEKAFGEVSQALTTLGDQFEGIIEELGGSKAVAVETHGAVLDLHAELQRLGGLQLANSAEVRSLLEQVQHHLSQVGMQRGEVKPQHSFSIRGEDERRFVKALLARFRGLPPDEQRRVPALLNGLGKLQLGTGEFVEAGRTFAEVVAVVDDPSGKAEASYNGYRVALEEKKYDAALKALRRAASLDAGRFAPFPLHRYEPRRILGAGGFGTAVLCHDRHFDEEVVVKTLHAGDLERGLDDVFREARVLRRLSHPAIIGVRDCEYADPAAKARPYLVMDYFPGGTLEGYVQQRGPLAVAELVEVATQMAGGMQTAHNANVWHRDLKPANVLVRREGDRWRVKIIDFGLALRRSVVETSRGVCSVGNTVLGDSVAGTLQYAPPEQMGRLPGVKVGPYSDVYAFGKTCCYALFKTTEPRSRHLAGLPAELRELLEGCIEQELEHRYASFAKVLSVLEAFDPARKAAEEEAARREREAEQRQRQEAARRQEEQKRREQEEAARRLQEQARLRQEGEAKLARLVREALERTRGKPTAEDTAAANELVRQHHVEKGRADEIVREERERWQKAQPKEPRPGDLTTIDLGNGVEMKFAWCPPGTFLMGSPSSEEQREWFEDADETQHRVTLTRGYWLSIHPVTQAQWQAVMGSNPSRFKGDTLPVETVSWNDCQKFVKRLGQKTGKRFRLPTEAEWEHACRAGTATPFHFGETISTEQANYDGDSTYGQGKKGVYRGKTTPVGSFPANAWGLYDMHGNVWEWCQDWYGRYPSEDIKDYKGINIGTDRVLRGGSWCRDPGLCRSACRLWNVPVYRGGRYGCRVLLCLD